VRASGWPGAEWLAGGSQCGLASSGGQSLEELQCAQEFVDAQWLGESQSEEQYVVEE
jgi:hypothetical protein